MRLSTCINRKAAETWSLPSHLVTAEFHNPTSCSLVPQKCSTKSFPRTSRYASLSHHPDRRSFERLRQHFHLWNEILGTLTSLIRMIDEVPQPTRLPGPHILLTNDNNQRLTMTLDDRWRLEKPSMLSRSGATERAGRAKILVTRPMPRTGPPDKL